MNAKEEQPKRTSLYLAVILSTVAFIFAFVQNWIQEFGLQTLPRISTGLKHPAAMAEMLFYALGASLVPPFVHVGVASFFKSQRNSNSRRRIFIGWSLVVLAVGVVSLWTKGTSKFQSKPSETANANALLMSPNTTNDIPIDFDTPIGKELAKECHYRSEMRARLAGVHWTQTRTDTSMSNFYGVALVAEFWSNKYLTPDAQDFQLSELRFDKMPKADQEVQWENCKKIASREYASLPLMQKQEQMDNGLKRLDFYMEELKKLKPQ